MIHPSFLVVVAVCSWVVILSSCQVVLLVNAVTLPLSELVLQHTATTTSTTSSTNSIIQETILFSISGTSSGNSRNSSTENETKSAVYTFEQFLSDFGRSYYDPLEYQERELIFYTNVRTIVRHNDNKRRQQQEQQQLRDEQGPTTSSSSSSSSPWNVKQSGTGYWMGINSYTDRRAEELHRGYDKYQSTIVRTTSSSSSSIRASTDRRQLHYYHHHHHHHVDVEQKLGIHIVPVQELPTSIDWRTMGVTTPIKSQGQCGSCWAFASTAVLESHIAIQTGYLYDFSPQELVSCTSNAHHCGGTGGCAGATAELAFDLVKNFGIVQEWTFGYQDGMGVPINCSLILNPTAAALVKRPNKHPTNMGKSYFRGAVAGIDDYLVLPSNNYTILMNVVAKFGPVAVSVACMPWHLYQSGIFDAPFDSNNSTTSTDLDHLVVLEGYGTDIETNEDFWLVRNSWGPRWGEHGYIRLKRRSGIGEEEENCGYDVTPADGTACTFDPTTGKEIVPLPQKICGNSGILFDSSIPMGGYII